MRRRKGDPSGISLSSYGPHHTPTRCPDTTSCPVWGRYEGGNPATSGSHMCTLAHDMHSVVITISAARNWAMEFVLEQVVHHHMKLTTDHMNSTISLVVVGILRSEFDVLRLSGLLSASHIGFLTLLLPIFRQITPQCFSYSLPPTLALPLVSPLSLGRVASLIQFGLLRRSRQTRILKATYELFGDRRPELQRKRIVQFVVKLGRHVRGSLHNFVCVWHVVLPAVDELQLEVMDSCGELGNGPPR